MGRNVGAICALRQREWACDSHCCDFLFIPVQGDWHLHSGGTACSESHGSVSDSRHKRFWQDMTPARICLWWRAHREGISRRCFVTEKFQAGRESVKAGGDWVSATYSVPQCLVVTLWFATQCSSPRASAKIGPLTKEKNWWKKQKKSQWCLSTHNCKSQHKVIVQGSVQFFFLCFYIT